jgi:radical SAM protein with 4Fe4S-binding SPASM domain|tara:strand:+ start:6259 stop:7233 length:975 start_codon:yes stop_codon:yes gene_type:complete
MSINTEYKAIEVLTEIKGQEFIDYRDRWEKVNTFELETDFPMFLQIEPNYKCNYKCPMCTQGDPKLIEKFGYQGGLKTKDIKRIVDEAKLYNCPSIALYGDNEPFLIKNIPEWFAMARDAGFIDIMAISNGSVMTESLAARILDSGLTRLRFSLDAVTPETYAKIRIGGVFTRTIRNIEMFLNAREKRGLKLPQVGVNFVKMSMNQHELEPFLERWENVVDFVVVQDFMKPDIEGDYQELDITNRPSVENFRCTQPWQRLYIRGNGDVTVCCAQFNSYLVIGNIHKDSLYDLWNSEQSKEFRAMHKEGRYYENPICLACSKDGG